MEYNGKPFSLDFDLTTGMCNSGKAVMTDRFVSDMIHQFRDRAAAEKIVAGGDRMIYSFLEMDQLPERSSELRFGTSVLYPGLVGEEYFMTKGHFHTIIDTAEVYYCLSGQGAMLMETPEGDVQLAEMRPGEAVYVPPRYAHRSINTGEMPLVMFFVFRSDAGHDYGTIEDKGFRKLLVNRDGKPTLVDNPRWIDG